MTGTTDIRQLDDDTVARIAAGEVVERPASAVKELVENSLDADATRIDVTVEDGGRELLRVADDGRGMTEADLRAAVRQHTTSKIRDLEDLESGVATLGFRGEALHTIGSVSRMRIRSRPRAEELDDADAEPSGTELVYEGGEVTSVEPTGCPEGTIVEVEDLFYNTPARRKFLKTTATEFAHVNRVVTRYALANPGVAISLEHDGREVFATTGQGDLQGAVLSVYGREVARSMIPVEAGEGTGSDDGDGDGTEAGAGGGADGSALPPGPVESITGLVSHPETNRSSREYLSTYVNGRAVTADAIREGIMGAYGGQLGGDRYPFVVCFLEVPGEAVDVNVHPRKLEVRFGDDDAVRRQVDAAVEAALLEHGLLRSRAPRGRSAPGEARIEPGSGSEESGRGAPAEDVTPGTESSEDGGPGDAKLPQESGATGSVSSAGDAGQRSADDPSGDTGAGPRPGSADSGDPTESTAASESTTAAEPTPDAQAAPDTTAGLVDSTDESRTVPPDDTAPADSATDADIATDAGEPSRKFEAASEQRTLDGEAASAGDRFDSLPPLRVLGQLRDTYVVCEAPEGLVLIDQHAADERVNYERLQRAFADDPTAQALASPVELELTPAEAEAFGRYREALERLGFYADFVGGDDGSGTGGGGGTGGGHTVAVTTVPAVLQKTLDPDRLRDVLASFVAGDREAGAETVDALADDFLADLACYPSITGNTSLTEGSVVDLLAALDDCENPYACPHGRPVIVRFDEGEIEDRFERDYPGHGG